MKYPLMSYKHLFDGFPNVGGLLVKNVGKKRGEKMNHLTGEDGINYEMGGNAFEYANVWAIAQFTYCV